MKKCADCGRQGLLLRVDTRGLCGDCATRLDQRLNRRVAKIRHTLAAVDAMEDVEWVVDELCRAETQCRELERLERTAHVRVSPRTETLLRNVRERRDRVLTRWAGSVTGAVKRQLERLPSLQEKQGLLCEAIQRLQGFQNKLYTGDEFRSYQRELSSLLVRLQMDGPEQPSAEPGPALQLVQDPVKPTAKEAVESAAAEDPAPADRRRAPRSRRQFKVTLSPGRNRCLAEDISSTGMLLRSAQEQRVGDFLDLDLHTHKGRYHATGMVVWTGYSTELRGLPNTLGVAFTGGVPVVAA